MEITLTYISVAAAVFNTLWMLQIAARDRFMFVKPSMQVLVYVQLLIAWPLAARTEYVRQLLPFPGEALILVHGFVGLGLAVSRLTLRRRARDIFAKLASTGSGYVLGATPYLVVLIFVATMVTIVQVMQVPFSRLGLVTVFLEPELAALAREESHKLIESELIRYGLALQVSTVVPLSAVIVYGLAASAFEQKRVLKFIVCLFGIAGLILIVSLSGARANAALVFTAIIASIALRRGLRLDLKMVVLALTFVIMPPVVLTIAREGLLTGTEAFAILPEYVLNFVSGRIFGSPLDVGIWYMQHAQTNGEVGLHGLPRLADLFGIPSINLPNEIGLAYTSTPLLSVSANAGYVFAFYAYFGLLALPLALVGLWLLDLLMYVYSRLDKNLLLPTIASLTAAGLFFVTSDFTVTLISHGYLLIPATALALVWARGVFVQRGSR